MIRKDLTLQSFSFTENHINAHLSDGRTISCPLNWFPHLVQGGLSQRMNYRISADGSYAHWPELDEDLSLEGFFSYSPKRLVGP